MEFLIGITFGFGVALVVIGAVNIWRSRKRPPVLSETETWLDENWEPQTETMVKEDFSVSKNTQLFCPVCQGKSYLKDGKCAICYHKIL